MNGQYAHNIDAKGRLFIPTKLRDELGGTLHVTIGQDHCLSVYSDEGWARFNESLKGKSFTEIKRLRMMYAYMTDCVPDAQGRILLPAKLRQYANLEKEVVIIGIVVTFAGSGLIERWRVAREVRATMLLVHAELETNRADFMQVWDYQQWEMRACKFLTDNRRDLKRIPSDTLASFDPVYGRIHFFHPRRDAFEVLKNSGLMSSVPDKDFLLAVTQGYAVLADLEENISMYYQLKLTAQNDMSKDFSEKQRERFYTGDMYERWECIFSVPCFAEFMLTAPYYFPEGYIEGLLADVDRSIRAIEAKYKLDKKPTDD